MSVLAEIAKRVLGAADRAFGVNSATGSGIGDEARRRRPADSAYSDAAYRDQCR
jgi:hypothetical protein